MSNGNDRPRHGNVFALTSPPPQCSAKIDRIEAYWNRIRGNRLVPSRCEIDPRGLEGVLGHAFILERIAGSLARFRVAGSHLTDLSGVELRQMPLSVLFTPASRETLADVMQSVFDEPALVRMSVASPAGFGRARLAGEMILLPLRSDLGDIDRVLGGIAFDGKIGRTPRRIEILDQTRRSMTGYAGSAHLDTPGDRRAPSRPGGSTRPVSSPEQRQHLRLVVSND